MQSAASGAAGAGPAGKADPMDVSEEPDMGPKIEEVD